MKVYSDFFKTMYDDRSHMHISHGVHYSILRSLCWSDYNLSVEEGTLHQSYYHDLCVVWDEDHDERIFELINILHINGLLPAINYIGERKGAVSIIINPNIRRSSRQYFEERFFEIFGGETVTLPSDQWHVEFCGEDDLQGSYILGNSTESQLFVFSVNHLWGPGIKEAN